MLSGKQVRVRHARHKIVPLYLKTSEAGWLEVAERLTDLYRSAKGASRAEIEDDVRELLGDQPSTLVHQGLAKLLEDRCEFEVQSDPDPEQIREALFRTAGDARRSGEAFDRAAVVERAATALGIATDVVEAGLFADLRAEQRLVSFQDITPEQLLNRYNVALAQAVLLRATNLEVDVRGETTARYRQLFRAVKFHRLMCDITAHEIDGYRLKLDGPLSLFSATQRYGLQLAFFLPHLLQCKDFDLKATVKWGTNKTAAPKNFILSRSDGLRSHIPDYGTYIPKELEMFSTQFRKTAKGWEIHSEPALVTMKDGVWVPDFQLVRKSDGACVYLEVLGFWRKTDVDKQLHRLRESLPGQFLLAVSEQYVTDEKAAEQMGPEVYRFKKQPSVDEVVKRAVSLVG